MVTLFKLVKTGPDSSRLVHTCPDLSKLVQTCPDLSSLAYKDPDLSWLVQIVPDSSRVVKTCPNMSRLIQTPPVWSILPCYYNDHDFGAKKCDPLTPNFFEALEEHIYESIGAQCCGQFGQQLLRTDRFLPFDYVGNFAAGPLDGASILFKIVVPRTWAVLQVVHGQSWWGTGWRGDPQCSSLNYRFIILYVWCRASLVHCQLEQISNFYALVSPLPLVPQHLGLLGP